MPRSKLCPLFSIMSEEGVKNCRPNCAWYISRPASGDKEAGECAILEMAYKILSR